MMDYQTNPEGKPQRYSTPMAAGVVVLSSLLLLIVLRHGLRGLI
jgi:hypothetical protein